MTAECWTPAQLSLGDHNASVSVSVECVLACVRVHCTFLNDLSTTEKTNFLFLIIEKRGRRERGMEFNADQLETLFCACLSFFLNFSVPSCLCAKSGDVTINKSEEGF